MLNARERWLSLGMCALLIACARPARAAEAEASLDAAAEALSSEDYAAREKGEEAFRHAIAKGEETAVRAALAKASAKDPAQAELQSRAARILSMCEGGPVVNNLRARLISERLNAAGALELHAPFKTKYTLKLRLTNLGDQRVQIALSSYENYHFCKLAVSPLGAGGKRGEPLPQYFDLYPLSDMQMPDKTFVSIAPGAWTERNMTILLNEGYLLRTITDNHVNIDEKKAFGALRTPGSYEIIASYQIEPANSEGKPPLFEHETGRKEDEPLWKGPKVLTQPLRLEIKAAKEGEAKTPAAGESKSGK